MEKFIILLKQYKKIVPEGNRQTSELKEYFLEVIKDDFRYNAPDYIDLSYFKWDGLGLTGYQIVYSKPETSYIKLTNEGSHLRNASIR